MGRRRGGVDCEAQAPVKGNLYISHWYMNDGRHILLCVLFLFLAATPLCAQMGYSEFERDMQLSEAQRARVEETKRRYMHELHGLNQDYVNKRLELREMDRYPYSDPERKQRLRSELRAIESARHSLYNQYRSDVSRAFNPEQRNRYNNFVDTERRRSIPPPRAPSSDRFGGPPMTRVNPPGIDNRPVSPPASRPMPPPSQPRYQTTVPPPGRPMEPPSGRPMTPPPPRGYGR